MADSTKTVLNTMLTNGTMRVARRATSRLSSLSAQRAAPALVRCAKCFSDFLYSSTYELDCDVNYFVLHCVLQATDLLFMIEQRRRSTATTTKLCRVHLAGTRLTRLLAA
jgi:hypothetical protein